MRAIKRLARLRAIEADLAAAASRERSGAALDARLLARRAAALVAAGGAETSVDCPGDALKAAAIHRGRLAAAAAALDARAVRAERHAADTASAALMASRRQKAVTEVFAERAASDARTAERRRLEAVGEVARALHNDTRR